MLVVVFAPGLLEKVWLTNVRSFFSHAEGRLVECDADQVTLTKRLADWAILTLLPTASLDQLSSLSGMGIALS